MGLQAILAGLWIALISTVQAADVDGLLWRQGNPTEYRQGKRKTLNQELQ